MDHASVIGSGPNGLSAAIVLAQAGLAVDVYEAEAQLGGAARTLPLTLPGYLHDFGSAVHPMAAGSPFFASLPLEQHGLHWIHSPAVLAHPFDDGTAVLIRRDIEPTLNYLREDRERWRDLFQPFAEQWPALAEEILGPVLHLPRSPLLLARFGLKALQPARYFAESQFHNARTRAVFAGLAAHSFLSLDSPASAAVGLVFAITAHAVGWPIPQGGAQSITNALAAQLAGLGGAVHTSRRIASLTELPDTLTLCDIPPQHLQRIAANRLTPAYHAKLNKFRHGPGAFKIDYALSRPIPWRADDCELAATVHLGGMLEEIAHSEGEMFRGRVAEKPFVLVSQPSLFDPTRAPTERHIAWAYCHVPNGSKIDMTERIENQIERFAPGFRDCVLQRRVFTPSDLEAADANLIGGDVSGGAMTVRQLLFRPTLRAYATSDPKIYLCSASTPPGGGVHGMCGFHAAKTALQNL
ncbi:MAG: NAD(P)/FAD-dependent oxidoreductase [Acidobacteriaceae bacterium]